MNRRQFLRAAALAGSTAAVARVAARESRDATSAAVASTSPPSGTSRTRAGTPMSTPSPTPTEAVATPTSGWEPTGSVAVPGATETVVTPDGETAFVATGDGFAAVDLADPADPAVVTRETDVSPPRSDAVMGGVFDVKYDDERLLVAGPANHERDVFYGVALFDVSDPADPVALAGYRTTFPVHNCYLDGDYAYLTGNDGERNPLVVVDIVNVREAARWSVVDHDERWREVDAGLRTLHDVYVQNGYAYLAHWDAGTWILDVSDPANPAYVADVREQSLDRLRTFEGLRAARKFGQPPGNDHYAATGDAGELLAVGAESWDSDFGTEGTPGPEDPGGPGGIALYDVSDPAEPVRRATIDPPPTADPNVNGVWTTAHNFEVADDRLYSSWYRGGVKVHDVSDPADPRELRHFRHSSTTSFWTAQLAVPGETVVATSYEHPQDPDAPGVVYTFPDAPRATPTPTATGSPTPTETPSPTVSSTASPTQTDGRTRAATPTATPDDPPTATDESPATNGSGPGFGALAALGGLGLGAWRLVRDGDGGASGDSGDQ